MEVSTQVTSSIVIPGPELRQRVDKFAANLSVYDKTKADEMIAKVLASSKRNMFLFVDPSHIFYQYFLSKLTEFRTNPELRPAKEKKSKDDTSSTAGATGNSASSTSIKMTRVGNVIRTSGGSAKDAEAEAAREKMLHETEMEARRYLTDPFPSLYNLDTKSGTIELSALMMDLMTCTAQYVAKYGKVFLNTILSKQRHNPLFRFLHEEDIRHDMFNQLVRAYEQILHYDADETETRLENLTSLEYVLDTVCKEKTKYAKASLARRKAALLTDDELRAKLEWKSFKVIYSFTLADLALDDPRVERPAKVARVEGKQREVAELESEGHSTSAATKTTTKRSETASLIRAKVGEVNEQTSQHSSPGYKTVDLTSSRN